MLFGYGMFTNFNDFHNFEAARYAFSMYDVCVVTTDSDNHQQLFYRFLRGWPDSTNDF